MSLKEEGERSLKTESPYERLVCLFIFFFVSMLFSSLSNLYSLHTGATAGMTDIEVLDLLSAMAHDLTGIQENVFKIRVSC